MKNPTGYVIHTGQVNGKAFVAIATLKTSNRKTGDMVQIWFLLRDINPVEAVKNCIDAQTVCRDCPFASGKGCYVNVGQAPLAVWRAFHRGAYPVLSPVDYSRVFGGRKVRFGAYGNPTLLPLDMVKSIAKISAGWTGYFHDWRSNPQATSYGRYFMASTETRDSFKAAIAAGFRVFHASPEKPKDTIECLSESRGLACADCKLCNGVRNRALPSVWINPHGSKSARAVAVALN